MDSSSVLRQQSQNKIRSDFQRMKNEHNKRQADPKSSKPVSVSHLSNKDSENKPPGNSEVSRKAPVRPGVSRLPVLAKSVHLQTPTDFSQSHSRWEEKPLAGKTKKKKPCTRPVPFNLSQPKNTRVENQQTVPESRTGAYPIQPKNYVDNSKPTKHPAVLKHNVDSTKAREGKFQVKTTEGVSHLSGPSKGFKTSATLSKPDNTVHQKKSGSSGRPALNAEVCLNDMNLLSLKDPSKISNAGQTKQVTAQDNPSEGLTGEKFRPDHAALLSVLRNEGVSITSLASAAPQSKPYNYLPQRVSVMKSQKTAGPSTASVKSVQFTPDLAALQSILQNQGVKDPGLVGVTARDSVCPQGRGTSIYTPQRVSVMKSRQKAGPSTANTLFSVDPAALQSILQNEGVKAGGPVGATPRNSQYPPGRGTSIYSAQRVPVRKAKEQTTPGPAVVPLKESPLKKWNPQRVRDTRHQPMSAMKWHQSPYGTPGLRSCKNNPQLQQEQEVVQRLFDDEEDVQNTNVTEKAPETRAEQLPVQASPIKSHHEEKAEMSRTNDGDDDDDEEEEEGMQKFEGGQMFLQAPHRESVIFFSTGKKLIRAPYFTKQESSTQQDQCGSVSSEQKKLLPVHDDKSTVSEPTSQNHPCVQRLHRDLVQKSALSPVATMLAMLRKRLPPLEELRMDEEVATYTSVSVPALPACLPPRPRCGNPLASTLHFEESTKFVPIDFNLSPGPSSLLQER